MPVKRCQKSGRPGYKFGDAGKCFTGPNAKAMAAEQGRAIKRSQAASRKKVK